ncbi:stationary phase survival protein SurE [Escherichia coli]|uniref:5'-nucleotidase n=1 Tax=Escherichia coli TaxID=562 RepID=A0A376TT86_ECOLX|nr:stationary phase survival protein SurE [Escherichia coli]
MTGYMHPVYKRWRKPCVSLLTFQVVAPDRNRSGASNSLTLESSLRTFTFENGDIAVQMGTPTDCVYLGVNALMRPRPGHCCVRN